jgi:hypothetical protein
MLRGFTQNHAGPKNNHTDRARWEVFRVHVQADKKPNNGTQLDWGG